ncbi:hypothetical protein T02_4517 [Trichinella nativa]|uniref:Uncharacterized protein n=1 Tax=Trichinella nativa TaxID=6335 RepID=A0A0V1KKX7_9BILA|nr:hypothetical protein T02_4517 [Trichinella nativa]
MCCNIVFYEGNLLKQGRKNMDSRFPAQQKGLEKRSLFGTKKKTIELSLTCFSKVGCDLPQQSNNVPISNNPTKG